MDRCSSCLQLDSWPAALTVLVEDLSLLTLVQEKEAEVETQVQTLSDTLRNTERHKRFLQRSNRLLAAATNEVILHQVHTAFCLLLLLFLLLLVCYGYHISA